MPRSAPSQCLEPNCPTLCNGTTRCPEHTVKRTRPKTEHDAKASAFYNSTVWRRLSRSHHTRHPLCVSCHAKGRTVVADVADHIVEIRDNWARRLDPKNLQSLCHQCHATKTQKAKVERSTNNQSQSTPTPTPKPMRYRG